MTKFSITDVSKFRNACGTIHRNLDNKARRDNRMKLYETVATQTFMYANKTWTFGKKEEKKVEAAKMIFVRRISPSRSEKKRIH